MTGLMDKDSDPYKQENYQHMQEKPKIGKMVKLKRTRILRKQNAKS